MAPPSLRPRLEARASAFPEDALYEILLCLPAKDACRLRAVCRSWRSLLSEPHFIAAHAAHHTEPLLVVGYHYQARSCGGRVLCDIVDLSGRVIKRVVPNSVYERVMCMHLDLICVAKGGWSMSCELRNPDTGDVHALPEGLATDHAVHGLGVLDYWASIAFGLVASTGEYKVLRVLEPSPNGHRRQLYEVFTLDDHGNNQACWRAKQAPPYDYNVELGYLSSMVTNGIVYFLLRDGWGCDQRAEPGLVASFDLETEEWSASVRGPLTLSSTTGEDVDASNFRFMSLHDFSLTVLSGSLVLGCRTRFSSMAYRSIDLWFMMDFGKGLWVKQQSIEISDNVNPSFMVQPLLVLSDGKIVLDHFGHFSGFLKIYDPWSKTSTDVAEMNNHATVGLYGGNLLSLANHSS